MPPILSTIFQKWKCNYMAFIRRKKPCIYNTCQANVIANFKKFNIAIHVNL